MTALYRFRWFRRWQGGVWYNIRRDTLEPAKWIRGYPSSTDVPLKKEWY